MADQTIEKRSSEVDDHEREPSKKKDVTEDPETFSCMLQPCPADSDPKYVGIRRLLLFRKAQSGVLRRKVHFISHLFQMKTFCYNKCQTSPEDVDRYPYSLVCLTNRTRNLTNNLVKTATLLLPSMINEYSCAYLLCVGLEMQC